MALPIVHNQDRGLVLSSDSKPRLNWTPELHQLFINAVSRLGGADKATPKSLMKMMGINGLTLYHLKSHLQKYRLGIGQQSQSQSTNIQEEEWSKNSDGNQGSINEHLQIAKSLEMQMELQRKLHDQIEVQKHLQLRIEAQGKYLESVLVKAQGLVSQYSSYSIGAEIAKAKLPRLVSMVGTRCPSSPAASVLTETGDSIPWSEQKKGSRGRSGCSSESSSLTSDDSTGGKFGSSCQPNGKKRCGGSLFVDDCVEQQPSSKGLSTGREQGADQFKKTNLIDLNRQFPNDSDWGSKAMTDLNLKGS